MVSHKLLSVLPPGVKISLVIISRLWDWHTRPAQRSSHMKVSNVSKDCGILFDFALTYIQLAAIIVKEGKAWVDAVSEGRRLCDDDKIKIMRRGEKESAVIIDRFWQDGVDIS
jgi:hypothetical protein